MRGTRWRGGWCAPGIFIDEDACRDHRIGEHDFEDVALGRAQASGVLECCVDVGVAADAPEVVPLVVIERGFVAKPAIRRVGVEVDLDIPGIVVQVVHLLPPKLLRVKPIRSNVGGLFTFGDRSRQTLLVAGALQGVNVSARPGPRRGPGVKVAGRWRMPGSRRCCRSGRCPPRRTRNRASGPARR